MREIIKKVRIYTLLDFSACTRHGKDPFSHIDLPLRFVHLQSLAVESELCVQHGCLLLLRNHLHLHEFSETTEGAIDLLAKCRQWSVFSLLLSFLAALVFVFALAFAGGAPALAPAGTLALGRWRSCEDGLFHALPEVKSSVTTGGIPTLVTNLVNALNGLDPLLAGVKSLLSSVLNGVRGGILGSLTGTTQVIPLTNVVVFLTYTHSRLRLTISLTNSRASSPVVGGVNDILSGLISGAASATTGTQIFNTANNLLGQLTPVVKQVTNVVSGAPSKLNLAPLQTTVQNLANQVPTLISGLSNQCGTPAQSQILNTSGLGLQTALNISLSAF
ncbi:hypothetical protein B0H19DRAFT_1256989 [Mycena capillaripes]|nr:hypothetical protein B0H19DRAFT_1256989 [Mycena capillaripes]